MYAAVSPYAGSQPFNDWFAPDTSQRHALGLKVSAVDPYWGWGEFVYAKSGGALTPRTLCVLDEAYTAAGVPNAANQGFPVVVCMGNMSAISQYGWFMLAGYGPIKATATVAADAALGITGVGTVGANTAGKQILGVRNRVGQTGTKVLANVQTTNGSGVIVTNGYDGWFLGVAVTGTGIPASSVVAALDPDGRSVRLGSAVGTFDKLATATGLISATGTYTGFTLAQINGAFCQGAIT